MGIGFVVLFWAVVAVVLVASYFLLVRLGRRFPAVAFLPKVLVAAVVAVGLPVAAWVIFNFTAGFFPSSVFESNFGFSPPSDVTELRGRQLIIADSGEAFLRFRANKATVDRILGSRFFEIGTPEKEPGAFVMPEGAPAYWRPLDGRSVRYFKSTETFDRRFGFSQAFLSYDEPTGTVHFYWEGVD